MPAMKTAVARVDVVRPASAETGFWRIGIVFCAFALLWLEVINHLRNEWSLNAQYSYGWAVPLLAAFIFWRRWSQRPVPEPPSSRALPITLILLCALVLFPIRFIAEANPDWRLVSWAFAVTAAVLSISFIYLRGGFGWLRQFAFPFLFFLVAVPWPVRFEQHVIQGLMRAVTAINVSILNAIGVPALQHGNVIEVTSGLIGIEEACSGVRSLQATLMISLFLGELYSFNWPRRLLLVVAGASLAFVSNVGRTAILVWIGANRGTGVLENWHDPAGLTIMLICLFGLWFIGLFLRRRSGPEAALADRSVSRPNQEPTPRILGAVAGLAIWVIVIECGAQLWYGLHQFDPKLRWSVSWPTSQAEFKSIPIASEAAGMLRYSDGGGATWNSKEGRRWLMYFFHWLPGRTAALFVKIHRPEKCLPAAGLTLQRDNGIGLIRVNGVNLPIRSYVFDDAGATLHVYYCYWDARSSYQTVAAAEEEDWSPGGRVRAALRGRREVGAQMIELAVWGYEDDTSALEALRKQLTDIVHPGQPG
jgi:exosortase